MNYKLIAIATLIIAPILAMVASHVADIVPTKQPQNNAAPVAEEQQQAAAATPAPTPAPMAAPVAGATVEFGAPNPLAGQPMADAGAPGGPVAVAPPPPPPQQPSGILPPYPGQYREPAGGTVYLPDGRKVG